MRSSGSEIDLHGLQVEEALYRLDLFLDRAVRDALYTVWIIHGKGQGVLRSEVSRHLNGHPLVKSYELADHSHGGPGVTRVELDW
ncbi:Smr/MutS family protein [Chloroflexota bacterium]